TRAVLDELAASAGEATLLVTSTRADALETGRVTPIELPPLAPSELAARGVDAETIARCDGNPFAIETALRARAEGAAGGTTGARLQPPRDEPRRVAEVLAVAGGALHASALEAALPKHRLDLAIGELARRGFLHAHEPDRLASPTLRREIYESLD